MVSKKKTNKRKTAMSMSDVARVASIMQEILSLLGPLMAGAALMGRRGKISVSQKKKMKLVMSSFGLGSIQDLINFLKNLNLADIKAGLDNLKEIVALLKQLIAELSNLKPPVRPPSQLTTISAKRSYSR